MSISYNEHRRFWYFGVAIAFALHNLEEGAEAARHLAFMRSGTVGFLRDFYSGIEVAEFRISPTILTVVGALIAAGAARRPNASGSAFAMLVFAAVIGVNALAHIALALLARSYMPGLFTAVAVTLPLSIALLLRSRRDRWVPSRVLLTVVPVALLVHGPVLAGFIRLSVGLARAITRSGA